MQILTNREHLLPAALMIGGVVERRQTLPILGNVLLQLKDSQLTMTATDLEVEIRTVTVVDSDAEGELTLPAKKFIDICRALPEGADIRIQLDSDRAVIRSERSRFSLGVLPAADYPSIETVVPDFALEVTERLLKRLIDSAAFSMAQQDVRYYLNGMLLEFEEEMLRAVTTDGHRLAKSEMRRELGGGGHRNILLPRKAVLELSRLLGPSDSPVTVEIGSGFARFRVGKSIFTSKLIDGRFPDYERVIPKNLDKTAVIQREPLREALSRASILSGEKYKGIRMDFSSGLLKMQAHNPEQEEAEEEMGIDYAAEPLNIGFNVGYILDILNALGSKSVAVDLLDNNSSAVFRDPDSTGSIYVVMPMRL
jgi:DNA polymerase-3 subunit beta